MGKKITAECAIEPSVIAGNWLQLEKQIRHFISLGVKQFHLDVMDGLFVPNHTIGPDIVKAIRTIDKDVLLDVHLMVYEPFNHIKAFSDAGASEITFHVEATESIKETIEEISLRGCKVGLAFRPETNMDVYEKYFLDDKRPIHKALIMTVNPGFGGQKFIQEQLKKILQFSNKKYPTYIQVDGGVNLDTLKLAKDDGADFFVVGSYLYGDQAERGIERRYNDLKGVLD